jgi:hypothetical protein
VISTGTSRAVKFQVSAESLSCLSEANRLALQVENLRPLRLDLTAVYQ